MNEHVGIRKRVGEVVVVGDDQFQAQFPRPCCLLHTGDAAVHRDHDLGTPGRERFERLGVEAIALLEPVRHIPARLCVNRLEATHQDRGGAHAVGVVVAVDHDRPAGPCGGQQSVGRGRDARQEVGIAEVGHRAAEKRSYRRGIGQSACRQQSRGDRGDAGRPLDRLHQYPVVRQDPPTFRHGSTPFEK